LFNTDVGTLEFVTTDLLSHITSHAPSIGTPKHLSLYLNASTFSEFSLKRTSLCVGREGSIVD